MPAPPAGTFSRANTRGRLHASITYASSGSEPLAELTATLLSYDVAGRVTQSSELLDGVYYQTTATYNAAGAPKTETSYRGSSQISSVTNAYNAAGQLGSVARNGQTLATVSATTGYTAAGALGEQTLGNGLVHTISYNERLQPERIGLGTTATNFDRLKLEYAYGTRPYGWDASTAVTTTQNNGNVADIKITPGAGQSTIQQDFDYDALNRLTDAREYGRTASGDGSDTIGAYNPATGEFYLRNSNTPRSGPDGDRVDHSQAPAWRVQAPARRASSLPPWRQEGSRRVMKPD